LKNFRKRILPIDKILSRTAKKLVNPLKYGSGEVPVGMDGVGQSSGENEPGKPLRFILIIYKE
jgi:hypothetical protein